jgi:putative FmdB family regulatory protein
VVLYRYRCPECGSFDVARAIGEALPEEPCVECGSPATRFFTPPFLSRTAPALAQALNAQEASAYEPRVVNQAPPAQPRPARPTDPRHAGLPRP